MGFTKKARVIPLHISPGGDPVAYFVKGVVLAVRHEDAENIFGDNSGRQIIFLILMCSSITHMKMSGSHQKTSRKMIKDIDGSEVKGPCMIDSPFLGPIPPERLSGGVKTLILMQNDPDHIFNASACGNNCAQWILKLAEQKDITIRLGYIMDFGKQPFDIYIVNTGKTVHSMLELDDEIIVNRLLRG